MIKKIWAICLSAIMACALGAQTAAEFMQLGNSAYRKGDFAKACEYYRESLGAGGNSAELYFNAANACAKAGQKGRALLYYARANAANPRLREAEANMKIFARDNSINIPQKNSAEIYLMELSAFEWTIIGFAAFWCAVLAAFIPPLYGKRNAAAIFAALVCAVVACAGACAVAEWNAAANTAIALRDDVAVRVSPTAHAPIAATVQEGTFAKVLGRKGGFVYVKTPSGKRGWADAAEFAPVAQ